MSKISTEPPGMIPVAGFMNVVLNSVNTVLKYK